MPHHSGGEPAPIGLTARRGPNNGVRPRLPPHSADRARYRVEDRHAHFLGLLEDVCAGAELAGLRIELRTITGARIDGAASLAGEIDETSYDRQTVRIGTVEVAVEDVVSFTIAAPGV